VIHFLLQHRIAGAGEPPPGVTDPPDWSGQVYESRSYSLSSFTSTSFSFVVRANGTWSMTTSAGTVGGNWINPPASGIGAGYKVQFVITSAIGASSNITVTNGAASVVSLSADREFYGYAQRSTNGTTLCQRVVRVDIYNAADVLLASGSFTGIAEAEVGS
jgi:hypothetical protein